MSVEFTQARVREIIAIPTETMRHWRKVLPSLAERRRHAKLSAGDLLALAVIRELVRVAGINSSAIAPYAATLFTICNSRPWHSLAQSRIQIEGEVAKLVSSNSAAPVVSGPVISIQLSHIIEQLVGRLGARSAEQIELSFPLSAISGSRRS
jgi:hypothetical protein